jgi:hypothetical protein
MVGEVLGQVWLATFKYVIDPALKFWEKTDQSDGVGEQWREGVHV